MKEPGYSYLLRNNFGLLLLSFMAGIIVEPQRSVDRAVQLALSESRLKLSQFGIEPVIQRVELDAADATGRTFHQWDPMELNRHRIIE